MFKRNIVAITSAVASAVVFSFPANARSFSFSQSGFDQGGRLEGIFSFGDDIDSNGLIEEEELASLSFSFVDNSFIPDVSFPNVKAMELSFFEFNPANDGLQFLFNSDAIPLVGGDVEFYKFFIGVNESGGLFAEQFGEGISGADYNRNFANGGSSGSFRISKSEIFLQAEDNGEAMPVPEPTSLLGMVVLGFLGFLYVRKGKLNHLSRLG